VDEPGTWQWAAGVFFLLGSGFFSATDAGLATLGEVRVRQLVESGGPRARLLGIWARHPERVRIILLVGSTLVATGMGALLALRAEHSGLGLAWAMLVATTSLVLVGQVLPRVIGRRFPSRTAVIAIPVVHTLYWALLPVVVGVERATHAIASRFGRHEAPSGTTDQIEYLIEVGTREGAFDEVREQLLNSVLEFADRVVKEIMVPRTRMVALDRNAPTDELLRAVTENAYSRMPVYQGSVDDVVGVLLLRDLVPELAKGAKGLQLDRHVKPPFFVPEQMKISRLLKEMQRRKVHLAIVVDEFGGTSGIVTLEDVIEEIVGEIQDEADAEAAPVRAMGNGVYVADAGVSLHDLEEFLNTEAPGEPQREIRFPEDGDYETLGGFVSATAGRVPPVGSQIGWDGLTFTVRAGDERRVAKVEIARRRHEPQDEQVERTAEQGT
jgi:putative hemolysin